MRNGIHLSDLAAIRRRLSIQVAAGAFPQIWPLLRQASLERRPRRSHVPSDRQWRAVRPTGYVDTPLRWTRVRRTPGGGRARDCCVAILANALLKTNRDAMMES
jgi:hypothetical protein